MVTKVSGVYRVENYKNDHRQAKDGVKKKEQEQFKNVLAKVLMKGS